MYVRMYVCLPICIYQKIHRANTLQGCCLLVKNNENANTLNNCPQNIGLLFIHQA